MRLLLLICLLSVDSANAASYYDTFSAHVKEYIMKEHTQRIMKRCYSSYCKGMNPMDSVRFIPVVDIYWKPNVSTRLSKLNDKQYLSCGSFWEMFDYKHFTIDSFFALQKDRFFYFERNKSSGRPFQFVHQPDHLRFQEAILALFNKSEADVFILFSGMPAGLEERVFMKGRSLFLLGFEDEELYLEKSSPSDYERRFWELAFDDAPVDGWGETYLLFIPDSFRTRKRLDRYFKLWIPWRNPAYSLFPIWKQVP